MCKWFIGGKHDGREVFYTTEQVARAQEKARRLGVWASPLEEERELKQFGGSLVVSIPKAMAKSLNLAPRQRVRITPD
ncbi:MAG: AbrB/MazE/SpoVT family DNA-binding domain-containing protein [Candidatus Hodarchaeaceae archaeon]|nr:AbrB/MazE/SpoVT family DNA-binding domain-containing protein [Candidatus Hodarchaeaceae archaeon]